VANAELLLDVLGDAGAGPALTTEAVRLRPVPEEFRDRPHLVRGEPGRSTRRGSRPKCLGTVVAGAGQPPADGLLGDIERLGDIALIPTSALQVQGTEPPPFVALRRDGGEYLHPSLLLWRV